MDKLLRKRPEEKPPPRVPTSLADRFAPSRAADSALDKDLVEDLRRFIANGRGRALVTAYSGSGLTTTIRLLAVEEDVELCDDDPNRAGSTQTTVDGRRKIVVIDDPEMASCKKIAATYDGVAPLLVATHPTRSGKQTEFAKKWETRVDFPRLAFDEVAAILSRVPGAPVRRVMAISATSDGDLRAAFNALELEMRGTMRGTRQVFTKDSFTEGLDAVDTILKKNALTLSEIKRFYEHDPNVVSMGVYENYPHVLTRNDAHVAAAVTEWISASDVFGAYEWEAPHEITGCLGVGGPAFELRRRKSATSMQTQKFGSVWSRIHTTASKRKVARAVDLERRAAGLTSVPSTELSFVRAVVAKTGSTAAGLSPQVAKSMFGLRVNDKSKVVIV